MAGADVESVKAAYVAEIGGGDPGCLGDYEPEVVTDADMDRLKFTDDDGTKRTFREELGRRVAAGDKFPCFFASTEY